MRCWVACLLLLASCGGGAEPSGGEEAVAVSFAWGHALDVRSVAGGYVITVPMDDPGERTDNEIAWALGSVAGVRGLTPGCLTDSQPTADSRLCPDEAYAMRVFGKKSSLAIVAYPIDMAPWIVAGINLWQEPSAFRRFYGSLGE